MHRSFRFAVAAIWIGVAGNALAVPTWTVSSLETIGCGEGNSRFATSIAGFTGGNERFRTQVDAGGLRYMDQDAGVPSHGNGFYTPWTLFASSSGGPTTGTWPIPPNIPITVNFEFIAGSGGPVVFQRQVIISQCNGGTISSNVVLISGGSSGAAQVPTLQPWSLLVLAGLVTLLAAATLAGWRGTRR